MPDLHSNYPTGKLLIAALEQSNHRLPGFVSALGFGNIPKGIRHVRMALASGVVAPALIDRLLASRYAPGIEALNEALRATEEIFNNERIAQAERKRDTDKERFRPHIAPLTELQRPSSITIFALLGGFERLTIALPQSYPTWERGLQLRFAQARIRRHYRSFSGSAPLLGAITGYRLFSAFGETSLCFTVDGQLVGVCNKAVPAVTCGLTSKSGRLIEASLFTGVNRPPRGRLQG